MVHEPRPHRVRPVDQLPSGSRVPPLRKPLRRGSQMAQLLRLGSVPIDGFRQLTYRESLRDIEACLRSLSAKLYHMGFRCPVARSTLADANESRDWRIYADFAQVLIRIARPLYARDPIGVDLDQTLYALDSTTIDLCLSLFPWGQVPPAQGCCEDAHAAGPARQHPTFIRITDGKTHDVNILDEIGPSPAPSTSWIGPTSISNASSCSLSARRSSSCEPRRTSCSNGATRIPSTNPRACARIRPSYWAAIESAQAYPDPLRRVSYFDAADEQAAEVSDQQLRAPGADHRPHLQVRVGRLSCSSSGSSNTLRINSFYSTSENAVKTQIWIAVSIYVLIAIVRKTARAWKRVFTRFYRFPALRNSKKCPFYRHLQPSDSHKRTPPMTPTN